MALNSCNIIKTISLIKGGKVQQKHFYTEIPFENKAGLIAIKAKVNGIEGTYIFDTGAINLIQGNLSNQFTKSNAPAQVEDVNKQSSIMSTVKIKSIKINDINFINTGAMINKEPLKGDAACLITDGLIGPNLARKAIWQINYPENKIIITDDIEKLNPNSLIHKIDFKTELSGTPYVFVSVNHKKHKLIIDTGANGSFLDLADSTYLGSNSIQSYGASSAGLYGDGSIIDSTTYAKVNEVSIGTMNFDSAIFEISSDKTGLSIPGGALQDNIVTFNWKKNEIWFSKPLNIKREYNTMGLSASRRDNKLFIIKIVDKSPAYKANIKLGDQIISINGINYENISEEQYCKLLQNGGLFGESDSINLEWLHNDQKKNIVLKKEKLL